MIFFVLIIGFAALNTGRAEEKSAALGWNIERVDRGTKPALALDSNGTPTVVYMLERTEGYVKAAVRNDTGWEISTIAQGYFYGPPDVAIDRNDVPHVSYHDHQAKMFDPAKGDAVHAFTRDGQWVANTLAHPGHDGWDNRIVVDADNGVHISAIDPLDFGGKGVEYYFVDNAGAPTVESVGSGPLSYKYATSIALNPSGQPSISYYDQRETSLRLATRLGPDDWRIETVDDAGQTGLFSSMVIDPNGGTHISYFEKTGTAPGFYTLGNVKYAFRSSPDASWQITEVDALDKVVTGFSGARNLTSLALDSQGRPWIAYTDESVLRLATFDGSTWQTQTVAQSGKERFGQIVSLKLDALDAPHLAYATVSSKQPLDGLILYATPKPRSS